MRSIATDAKILCNDLARLQELCYRLGDVEKPERRAHLAWIHEYISQGLMAGPRAEVDDDPAVGVAAHFAMLQFYQHLVWVELSAKAAAERVLTELLARPRMQADRGLGSMVAQAAMSWESLTGRPASVNKVARANSHDNRPDFAVFVTNIAKLACDREPTLDEISTAFRTPKAAKNKSR